ncbi:MAG TPA: hypothetical protein VF408_01175 [Sediminibacterium sp.]
MQKTTHPCRPIPRSTLHMMLYGIMLFYIRQRPLTPSSGKTVRRKAIHPPKGE